MNKRNLNLVWINPKFKTESKFSKIWKQFIKTQKIEIKIPVWLKWWKTKEEKIEIIRKVLIQAFNDYDYTTGEINIYPESRAENEIQKMIKYNTLDYQYKRLILQQKFLKKMDKMHEKFKRKQA